jgi:hypothetical protein
MEDVAWLMAQPRTLEREHVVAIVKESERYYYDDPGTLPEPPQDARAPLAVAPRETGGLRESLARRIVATVTRMHIVDPWETMEQYHRRMEDVVMGLLAATPPPDSRTGEQPKESK